MADIKLTEEQVDFIKGVCKSFNNEGGEVINVLHKVQGEYGYLSIEVQALIAKELNIPVAKVYGIVSFYSFFTMIPKGKYPISVCLGTACYVRGGEKVLDELKKQLNVEVGGTTNDRKFSLDVLRCIGACGLAPVITIGDKVYGRLTPDQIKGILAEY
ncbi:MAG: NAD(P)H-dependent oxidoreductase subunit E [Bacteroidales bacterium]|nr:NAD(P)H-dependent oxidoreductase subunit E [Bacteroidales bacterium]MDD5978518.1 NAD(P)H-dependent oxidoreductase subunit E [Bacteroidales bacterium]MDD7276502.1 NAD(P)H-dependent oxidoreductase subunit E [Bacteroidales bacterium]MDY6074500.1 NAD(P)H-dependent oxidoreductase subunit E [Bacteroidales bacterium]